jgi:tetratricopeptide (TPR) repeat protein
LYNRQTSPGSSSMATQTRRRIDTWKEIAVFLDRDGRTVQRWEKSRNLPVHRIPGERGGVFAYSDELTEWLNQGGSAEANHLLAIDDSVPATSASGAAAIAEANQRSAAQSVAGEPQQHRIFPYALSVLALVVAASIIALVARHRHAATAATVAVANDRLSPNPQAREAYLRGRFQWNLRDPATLLQALALFKQAEQLDPHFAAAFVGEAETYELLPEFEGMSPVKAFAEAERAAQQAIALDPNSAAAHRAYAFALFYGDWHAKRAFTEFDHAVLLDPGSSQTHHWYANALMAVNNMDAASREMQRARELDPASTIMLTDQAYLDANRGEPAQQAIDRLHELAVADPKLILSRRYIALILLRSNRVRDWAVEMAEIARVTKSPEDEQAVELMQGLPRNSTGNTLGQRRLCAARNDAMIEKVVGLPDLARACMNVGDIPGSVALWKKSFQQRDPGWLAFATLPLPAQLAGNVSLQQLQAVVRGQINSPL